VTFGPSNYIPFRCAALQINGPDYPNRVPLVDRDGEAPLLRRRRPNHPAPPAVGARHLRKDPSVGFPLRHRRPRKRMQIKIMPKGRCVHTSFLRAAITGGLPSARPRRPCGPDLAAQGVTYQFGEAHLLASGFLEQELLDLSREPERHRHTAFWQFRSGHEAMCIIVSYTLSTLNFLALSYSL
jgi:hypothetical protein